MPPSCTVTPSARQRLDHHGRSPAWYGSAKPTWSTGAKPWGEPGPSWNDEAAGCAVEDLVEHHELARVDVGLQRPDAHGPKMARTPSARMAQALAR